MTLEDVKKVEVDLRKKEEDIYSFLKKNKGVLCRATRCMLESDADLFKRYAEMASDLTEDDLKENGEEFLKYKNIAVSGTLYEKIKNTEVWSW